MNVAGFRTAIHFFCNWNWKWKFKYVTKWYKNYRFSSKQKGSQYIQNFAYPWHPREKKRKSDAVIS